TEYLPRLDAMCWRGGVPMIGEGVDPATGLPGMAKGTPLFQSDQARLIGILYRLSQHGGRLVDPPSERDDIAVQEFGVRAVFNPGFHEPVWSHSAMLADCREQLQALYLSATDPDVRRVVRALLKQPHRIARIRQCDLRSCFRFFVDRSPTWRTS